MEYYYKQISNFSNLFISNLYNEYNKNELFKREVQKYKNILEKNPAIKFLEKTEYRLLKNVETVNDFFIKNKNIIPIKSYTNTLVKSGRLIKYLESFHKKLLYHFCIFKKWFINRDCFFIEKNILRNLRNLDNFSIEGRCDFELYPHLQNIVDIRNIQLITDTTNYKEFTLEVTTVSMNNIEHFALNIKCEKIENTYKITELTCEKF